MRIPWISTLTIGRINPIESTLAAILEYGGWNHLLSHNEEYVGHSCSKGALKEIEYCCIRLC
jgi:hypothetical protein